MAISQPESSTFTACNNQRFCTICDCIALSSISTAASLGGDQVHTGTEKKGASRTVAKRMCICCCFLLVRGHLLTECEAVLRKLKAPCLSVQTTPQQLERTAFVQLAQAGDIKMYISCKLQQARAATTLTTAPEVVIRATSTES